MRYILCLTAILGVLAGNAAAQTCPTPATISAVSTRALDALLDDPGSLSAEDRSRLSTEVRANTILLWKYKGINSLGEARAGLSLLTACISNGGCGFDKPSQEVVTGLYDFVNNKRTTLPAGLQTPPQSAIDWAMEKLACSLEAAPAAPRMTTASMERRPVPVLVPNTEEGQRQLESTQAAIRTIDDLCHDESFAGRAENCMKLATSFNRGIQGFEYDSDSANYYFKQACHAGNAMGCYNYGANLRNYGKTQTEKDLGTEYVGKACDLGSQMACTNYEAWTGAPR